MSDDKAKWAAIGGFQAMRQADHAKRAASYAARGGYATASEAEAAIAAAYERGLRRGMAIAREHEGYHDMRRCGGAEPTVDWGEAEAAMEREIEEAKR